MRIKLLQNQASLNRPYWKNFASLIITTCLATFGLTWHNLAHSQAIIGQQTEQAQPEENIPNAPTLVERETKVRSGDTLSLLLARLGVEDISAMDFIRTNRRCDIFIDLRTGQTVQATSDENHLLYSLSTTSTGPNTVPTTFTISRTPHGFIITNDNAKLEKRIEQRMGTVHGSIFTAADTAGLPNAVTTRLINLFSTNIDFAAELRKGDKFKVVYESFWDNGKFVKAGNILAAELINNGKSYQAIWFQRSATEDGYFDTSGKLLQKAFLKSPVEYTRVSSNFGIRTHPITGAVRAHKGIDLAAPTGTPVRAAGNGTVLFAGWRGGYGNFIHIGHWNSYSTAYGHLSRIASNISAGKKVNQGDIIGYVGSTGLSTGPHLHYEFRIDNVKHDPVQVEAPNAHPLTERELRIFRMNLAKLQTKLATAGPVLSDNTATTTKTAKKHITKKQKTH